MSRRWAAAALVVSALLVALMVLAATGCAGKQIPRSGPVGPALVVFADPDEFSPSDRQEVIEAVEKHLNAWRADFGLEPPHFTLQVLDVEEFQCAGGSSIGCTKVDGTVIVVRGAQNEVPAVYHELCHRAEVSAYGRDLKHEDPRWASWTERSLKLAEKIAADRSWW